MREIFYVKLNPNLHSSGTNVCTIAVVWCNFTYFTMHIVNVNHLYSLNKFKEILTEKFVCVCVCVEKKLHHP